MADNYLERKMEEYRSGKGVTYRHRTTPTGARPGTLNVKFPSRRVLVTGGARGIGRTIVKAFCDAGCRVAFCDIDSKAGAATAQATGRSFIPSMCVTPPLLSAAWIACWRRGATSMLL